MAKKFAKVGIALGFLIGLAIMTIFLCFRKNIALIFTNDESLVETISQGLLFIALGLIIFDCIF